MRPLTSTFLHDVADLRRTPAAIFEDAAKSLVAAAAPFRLADALIGVPALLLVLIVALFTGDEIGGAIAAGAAFSVGFGAPRRLLDRPWTSMIAATVTMAVATVIGLLLGHMPLALIAASGLAAGACGWLALHDEEHWWVALQASIALFVAGYFAGTPEEAAHRMGFVLFGGLVQTVCVMTMRHVVTPPRWESTAPRHPSSEAVLQHVVGAAAAVMFAALAARMLNLTNAYWAPMTALLVLKPGLRETGTRGLYRLAGTIAGCLVAGLVALLLPPGSLALAAPLAIGVGLSFALQKANYALFTSAVTASVVFLLALGHEPELETSEHRVIATLLGGGIALVVAILTRTRQFVRRKRVHRDVVQ